MFSELKIFDARAARSAAAVAGYGTVGRPRLLVTDDSGALLSKKNRRGGRRPTGLVSLDDGGLVAALPAATGAVAARFGLSSSGGLDPTGSSPDGQVEDLMFSIQESPLFVDGFEAGDVSGWQ